jgi:hypothetical protein
VGGIEHGVGRPSEQVSASPHLGLHALAPNARKYYGAAGSLLIQHGSYQWISQEDQPHIEKGQVLLYPGR